jgi:hypothetical protein
MPGYYDLLQQYNPSVHTGLALGSAIGSGIAERRRQNAMDREAQRRQSLADMAAQEQEAAEAREREFRQGMMSQDQIRKESARRAYLEANPKGAMEFEQAIAGPKDAGPELDPIGKRVILESAYRPGTQEFQKRYSELAAEDQKVQRYSAGADYAGNLRKEFQARGEVKAFADASAGMEKIEKATPTAAGDLATVFGFMKILDPGSSVREGEQADARNAAGVPERVRNTWNLLLTGQRLTPEQRADFRTNARVFYGAHRNQYEPIAAEYRRLAAEGGVDPRSVVLSIYPGGGQATQPQAPQQAPQQAAQHTANQQQEAVYNQAIAEGKSEAEAYQIATGGGQ